MKRAFSACIRGDQGPWGDAPGLGDMAPLALNNAFVLIESQELKRWAISWMDTNH